MAIITTITILLLAIGFYSSNSNSNSNSDFNKISLSEQNFLYFLLTTTLHFFKKYDIKYWIMSGTLLGGIRNDPPGMLYWDDDIDLGILEEEVSKLKRLLEDPEFNKMVNFNTFFGGYQFSTKTSKMHIDIFIYNKVLYNKNTELKTRYKLQGPHFQHEFIESKDEIFPTITRKFWNTNVEYPRQSVKLLKRAFGEDVLEYVHKWNHNQNSFTKIPITKQDRIPLHKYPD